MIDKPFQLHIVPYKDGNYGVALFQERLKKMKKILRQQTDNNSSARSPLHIVSVWGSPLHAITDQLLDILKHNGYRATDLSRTRKAPFVLNEESGVRLGLLMTTVKPLRKLARVEAISGGLRSMGAEEAYYWFSKCTSGDSARRAQRALRILMAEE